MKKFAVKSASKTVTTAGTRVALSTVDLWARGLILLPPAANSGVTYFGDVTVAAASGLSMAAGIQVKALEALGLKDDIGAVNLKNCYVDAATSGDKVSFMYFEEML